MKTIKKGGRLKAMKKRGEEEERKVVEMENEKKNDNNRKLYLPTKAFYEQNSITFSHLMGTFYRTIRLVEHGLKPIYVFDGKPPTLKSGELNKRMEKREDAQKALAKAQEQGKVHMVSHSNS